MSESQSYIEGAGTYRIGHYRDEKTDDIMVEMRIEKPNRKFYELEVTDTIARKLLKLLKGIYQ